jgi:hypothetical protein
MKTLLVRGTGTIPARVADIVRAGSTMLKEIRADEERDATTLEADRVVVWDDGEIQVQAGHGSRKEAVRLRWPEDEDKLRLLFQTGG